MQRERRARLRQQWEVGPKEDPSHDGKDQGDHARGGPEGPGGLHDQGTRQPHDQDLRARSPPAAVVKHQGKEDYGRDRCDIRQ